MMLALMQDDELKKESEMSAEPEADDDIVEFEYNADGEEDLKATLKKLRKNLKEEKVKSQEYLTLLQRERADFLNFKKDEGERAGNVARRAEERVILDLLPALDSYDMAFANKDAWEKVDKNWRMGVEYIHQQILKALGEYGVSPIETKLGDAFDANLHQPIETIDTDEKEKDQTISGITQTGYRINSKVIRPTRVNVFGYKE